MPEFLGLCGRNQIRPCIICFSTANNIRVGSYPSDDLPANSTIFWLASDSAFSFSSPIINPGDSFGLPLVGGFTLPGQFSGQIQNWRPITRAVFSFARCQYRFNVAHVLTTTEINSATSNNGIAEIDVGEHVFDSLGCTDQQEVINTLLTDQEKQDIAGKESEVDYVFRRLFQVGIPDDRNRLVGVKVNRIGIEYRLDNGSNKAMTALETNGNGNFVNENSAVNYRDGTSRTLLVDLNKITARLPLTPGDPPPPSGSLQAVSRKPKSGDVIYLTYVAVTEHYCRFSINIHWSITANSLPPQCFSLPVGIKVSAFRFFSWNVPDNKGQSNIVSGWRVIESDSVPINFTAAMGPINNAVLGDFLVGENQGIQSFPYMPARSTIEQINAFIQNPSTLPIYQVNLNQPAGDSSFHLNTSAQNSPNAYKKSDWYNRRNYSSYQNWIDAQSKVLFNVHPKSLLKRDIDKFGIEQFLALEIESDVHAGKFSLFPFMDDPDVNVPINGAKQFLDSTNFTLNPIQPVSRWTTANAEVDCAVGGGISLGFNSGFNGFGDVFAVYAIGSPIIRERFEKDTKVLVEIFATEGQVGENTIAIEGNPFARKSSSCYAETMREFAYTAHTNSNSQIVFNLFNNGYIYTGLHSLIYRPDIASSDITSTNPTLFEPFLGKSGLLGDIYGYMPGLTTSSFKYSDASLFLYKTTSREKLKNKFASINDTQITEITVVPQSDRIIIPVSTFYNGLTEIEYSSNIAFESILVFKSGNTIVGTVDSVQFQAANTTISISHPWIKADTIEIIKSTNNTAFTINHVFVMQLDDKIANDFLKEQSSSTAADKQSLENLKFFQKSVLFETDVLSIIGDVKGQLYIFFNDKDGGISCAQSNDNGDSWHYYYGIVEPINNIRAEHPFVIPLHKDNKCALFYLFHGKIMCKIINFALFQFADAFLIERFEKDRLIVNEDNTKTEKTSIFTADGQTLRRGTLSYAVAGDLTDTVFLDLTGLTVSTGTYSPNENRNIQSQTPGGSTISEVKNVRKNPLAIGSTTAFIRSDIKDIFFSAVRKENSELYVFFMGNTADGNQLQCNFSLDNGINWYDYLEYIQFQYNRLQYDTSKKTQFINISGSDEPLSIESTDSFQSQSYPFGLNVHWSRMKKDKIDGATSFQSPSKVIAIDSPYIFHHSFLGKFFVFYVYQHCLLCKVIDDGVFNLDPKLQPTDQDKGIASVKKKAEQDNRSYFIDGDLSSDEIRAEIHFFANASVKERQTEGNIIFNAEYGINQFNGDRKLSSQRVCAYKFSDCNVRVFYKLDSSNALKAATWDGNQWMVEEFLKDPNKFTTMPTVDNITGYTDVTGGFGGDGFGPIKH